MEAQSPEYKTLIYQTLNLQLAVQNHLIPLGAALVSSTLITPNQYENIRNSHNPTESRAAHLIHLIQLKVKQNPQCYHVFISVLGRNPFQYGAILQLLQQTFLGEQQPLTDISVNRGQSRVPPPSHCSGMCVCRSTWCFKVLKFGPAWIEWLLDPVWHPLYSVAGGSVRERGKYSRVYKALNVEMWLRCFFN